MEWHPDRIREQAVAAGGTYDYVKSKQVPPGEIWRVHDIAYENETGARGTFRLYIEGHGYNHYVSELQGPGAAELIVHQETIYLLPGEHLTLRQTSCTASDVLALYALMERAKTTVLDGEVQ
jgi:hypothetical protein